MPMLQDSSQAGSVAPPSSIDLLGLRVHRITQPEALALLLRWIEEREPHLVVTADASAVEIAAEDPEFRRIVNEGAALVTPDGTGLLWAAGRLGSPLPERVSGVDLAERLCEESARRGFGVFFYGAAPGVAERAAERIRTKYPGARIVGTAHGFLSAPEEQRALLESIRAQRPGVLLVAMGIPRQEKWISRHLAELGVPVCIGVGGTLDVFSGTVRRAPVWMQRSGLEWLFRLVQDPKKFSKVAVLPRFVLRVLSRRRID